MCSTKYIKRNKLQNNLHFIYYVNYITFSDIFIFAFFFIINMEKIVITVLSLQ